LYDRRDARGFLFDRSRLRCRGAHVVHEPARFTEDSIGACGNRLGALALVRQLVVQAEQDLAIDISELIDPLDERIATRSPSHWNPFPPVSFAQKRLMLERKPRGGGARRRVTLRQWSPRVLLQRPVPTRPHWVSISMA
jgi:hypothetical protein